MVVFQWYGMVLVSQQTDILRIRLEILDAPTSIAMKSSVDRMIVWLL